MRERRITPFVVLLIILRFVTPLFSQTQQVRNPQHRNDITMVNHASTVQVPVVVYFYVDDNFCGSSYIYNGTVTCTYYDGGHHMSARVRTADGQEHSIAEGDTVLDYNDFSWVVEMH